MNPNLPSLKMNQNDDCLIQSSLKTEHKKDVYGHVPWKTLIEKAHYHRVQLTATGHYRYFPLGFILSLFWDPSLFSVMEGPISSKLP